MEISTSKPEQADSILFLSLPDVEIQFEPKLEHPLTKGTLTIQASSVIFSTESLWITLRYPHIILHAIHRQNNEIYCQLDSEQTSEMRFIPAESSALESIFDALSKGASLHEDQDQERDGSKWITAENVDSLILSSNGDTQDQSGWITAENVESFHPTEAQSITIDKYNAMLESNMNGKRDAGQFEDADR